MISCSAYAQKSTVIPTNSYALELLDKRYLEENNEIGEKELVSSKVMALDLAEIYIKNYYGEKVANEQKPYLIADNQNEWIITGQILQQPILTAGGTFLIVISKTDGKVIGLMHDR
ncbi:YbbC/YhhH family protein [Entomomonas sp. E2T0]|uniref:YbbC/YhhH family protein n=1 Tax=Entomomonas sp. E2T0 TaxID=2930213 RepID=UPI0022284707|nr:YbbC/YhhH family protein [Entomomonas sp. E2T0]UYZ84271.1 YbbC/YhhH family protein [Entomomonas sp. E2T0]